MARTPADSGDAEFVRRARSTRTPSAEPGRNLARRTAMQVLYRTDLTELISSEIVSQFEHEHGFPIPPYTQHLVEGIAARSDEVDALIVGHLREDWALSRLGAVERAILRIGAFELLEADTPVAVVIDEAVELSKRYATPEAGKLVNGVLGSWARERTASANTKDTHDE